MPPWRGSRNDGNKLLMVNLWATWCGPCVSELPEIVTMNRMYRKRNFQLVTISLDEPDKKDDPQGAQGGPPRGGQLHPQHERSRQLRRGARQTMAGPIPYTLLIAPGGKVIYRKTGAIEPLDVKRAIVEFLGRTY